jgi:hypothetical protein
MPDVLPLTGVRDVDDDERSPSSVPCPARSPTEVPADIRLTPPLGRVHPAAMRTPLVSVALAFTVILSGPLLSGPLLSATPFQTGGTVAAKGSRPSDCPGRIGKLPFRSGSETRNERNGGEIVSLVCQYRKEQTRHGDPSVSISASYYTPSYDNPKGIGGFCWQVRGLDDPETGTDRGGVVQPVGDHFIRVQYRTLNDRAPKTERVRAAAVELAQDLVDEGFVLACPGATSAEEAAGPEDVLTAAREYLALAEEYDGQQFERPQDDYAALATAGDDFVSDVKGLMLPEIVQAQVDALIAASAAQARAWRLIASRSPGEGEDDDVAAILEDFDSIDADVAALSAAADERARADEALRQALGLPLFSDDLSKEDSPEEESPEEESPEEASAKDTGED